MSQTLIHILRKRGPFWIREIWFAPSVGFLNAFTPTQYLQCPKTHHISGFKRTEFATKIIDISQDESELQRQLDKTAAYEIRRAGRDGVFVGECANLDEFLAFYNAFARQKKGMSVIDPQHLAPLMPFLKVLYVAHEKTPIAMHAYLLDPSKSRARLLYSSSHFRDASDLSQKALIGRANRFLHWSAMLHFKAVGVMEYDLGGYALCTHDPQLKGINQFKDSFGGELRLESIYTSWLFHVSQIILRKIRRR